jgi:hypothetical protein
MDSRGLRERLEGLLDVTESLLGNAKYTEEDLKGIEAVCAELREELKIERKLPEQFPDNQWVFRIRRTQYARFGVSAKNYDQAHELAARELHANVESLRFTWDLSDPLDLSPIELEREPNG